MWDVPFETESNEIIVAVDFDQGENQSHCITKLIKFKITTVYEVSSLTTVS